MITLPLSKLKALPNHYFDRELIPNEQLQKTFIWQQQTLSPFNELIVSWNGKRPSQGFYLIQICLLIEEWSNWIDYALWGVQEQRTFNQYSSNNEVQVYQDIVHVLNEKDATGFKICVEAHEGADLNGFTSLFACTTQLKDYKINGLTEAYPSITLSVPGISQMALADERRMRICSPAATTAVIHYLSKLSDLSPLSFAENVWDSHFDIYGNWILNLAQASHELGEPWRCYVARFSNFSQILDQIQKGYPIILSIRGPLPGGAFPYASGHLMVIRGYHAEERRVLCMDPAFPADESTYVSYALEDFLEAWYRRQGVAYVFYAKSCTS